MHVACYRGYAKYHAPYKSNLGDDIFKGKKIVTGVCSHPCYTAYFEVYCCMVVEKLITKTSTHFVVVGIIVVIRLLNVRT